MHYKNMRKGNSSQKAKNRDKNKLLSDLKINSTNPNPIIATIQYIKDSFIYNLNFSVLKFPYNSPI